MYALISPGEGRERLFFVPSNECHDKGEEFVVKVVEAILDKNKATGSRAALSEELLEFS